MGLRPGRDCRSDDYYDSPGDHVELYAYFVLHADGSSRDLHRCHPKSLLADRGLAAIASVRAVYLDDDWLGDPVQCQIAGDAPLLRSQRFSLGGTKFDFAKTRRVQHFRA